MSIDGSVNEARRYSPVSCCGNCCPAFRGRQTSHQTRRTCCHSCCENNRSAEDVVEPVPYRGSCCGSDGSDGSVSLESVALEDPTSGNLIRTKTRSDRIVHNYVTKNSIKCRRCDDGPKRYMVKKDYSNRTVCKKTPVKRKSNARKKAAKNREIHEYKKLYKTKDEDIKAKYIRMFHPDPTPPKRPIPPNNEPIELNKHVNPIAQHMNARKPTKTIITCDDETCGVDCGCETICVQNERTKRRSKEEHINVNDACTVKRRAKHERAYEEKPARNKSRNLVCTIEIKERPVKTRGDKHDKQKKRVDRCVNNLVKDTERVCTKCMCNREASKVTYTKHEDQAVRRIVPRRCEYNSEDYETKEEDSNDCFIDEEETCDEEEAEEEIVVMDDDCGKGRQRENCYIPDGYECCDRDAEELRKYNELAGDFEAMMALYRRRYCGTADERCDCCNDAQATRERCRQDRPYEIEVIKDVSADRCFGSETVTSECETVVSSSNEMCGRPSYTDTYLIEDETGYWHVPCVSSQYDPCRTTCTENHSPEAYDTNCFFCLKKMASGTPINDYYRKRSKTIDRLTRRRGTFMRVDVGVGDDKIPKQHPSIQKKEQESSEPPAVKDPKPYCEACERKKREAALRAKMKLNQ